MNQAGKPPGAVPVSSSRNHFATHRTLIMAALVVAFLLMAIWTPW